ncbi:hypothetical protein E2C01_018458 [Portunus trituberculatus]|uniref:Secreted protein n=1 Tax=Portunus trituberculatus TaxID=210409 RepID=A0A5B7DV39_PORTR|nr:hypothetical protein [Portunus trituberculatus]
MKKRGWRRPGKHRASVSVCRLALPLSYLVLWRHYENKGNTRDVSCRCNQHNKGVMCGSTTAAPHATGHSHVTTITSREAQDFQSFLGPRSE